ncbi:MAG: hypothetical protein M0C28_19615 [Candidatus Moduliflexus flocculans]|nr:hypothetical protein [Candidatus Moduliflexus flocculans]
MSPRTASTELYCGLTSDRTEPPSPSALRLVRKVLCRLETSMEGMTYFSMPAGFVPVIHIFMLESGQSCSIITCKVDNQNQVEF